MYVKSTDPLPRNSMDPPTPAEIARHRACIAADARAIASGRRAAYSTVMSLQNLYDVAPQIAVDGQKILRDSEDIRRSSFFSPGVSRPGQVAARTIEAMAEIAPENVPLNGLRSQLEGCSKAAVVQSEASIPNHTKPVMPLPAPILGEVAVMAPPVIDSPQAPPFTNLCWALRNGVFPTGGGGMLSPDELSALQYRCTQLGYVGACPPPPRTSAWLAQAKAKGMLPRISASPDVLDGIPQAPDVGGMPCSESYRIAGMSGFSPPWGDAFAFAGSTPAVASPVSGGFLGWVRANPWLALGIAGVGIAALNHSSRRRR